jgi:hypothetical protein
MASLGPARQQDGSLNQRAISALNAMHEAFEGQVLLWAPSTEAVPEGGLGIAGLPALALTGGCRAAGSPGVSAAAVCCGWQLAALLDTLMLHHAVRPLVCSSAEQHTMPACAPGRRSPGSIHARHRGLDSMPAARQYKC